MNKNKDLQNEIESLTIQLQKLCSENGVSYAAGFVKPGEISLLTMNGHPLTVAAILAGFDMAYSDVQDISDPVELIIAKLTAYKYEGDPSKKCDCPNCRNKRAAEEEHCEQGIDIADIEAELKEYFNKK